MINDDSFGSFFLLTGKGGKGIIQPALSLLGSTLSMDAFVHNYSNFPTHRRLITVRWPRGLCGEVKIGEKVNEVRNR